MIKRYKNGVLFLSILFFIILIVMTLIMNSVNKVMLIDVIFMFGLSIFIIGGFLWIIEKGIYSKAFKIFKRYLKSTSKIESYVENYDVEHIKDGKDKNNNSKSIPVYVFMSGVILIIISTILATL